MNGKFENAVFPGEDQIRDMQANIAAGPIVMVNLLKFRDRAKYADGRATTLSGREAYMIYGREVPRLVRKHGGKIIYVGDVRFMMLGRADPLWDEVALAEYPSRRALFEMSMSPEWLEIAVHRTAGLEGQLNIETTPSMGGV